MTRRPRIAISLGDPCGIGPELLLGGLPSIQPWADVTVVGSRAGVDLLEDRPSPVVGWRWVDPGVPAPADFNGGVYGLQILARGPASGKVLAEVLWLDPTPDIQRDQLTLGEGSAVSGRATVEAIRVAALMTLAGTTNALVTLPMAKAAAHLAGYDIPGHTEFLQKLSSAPITRMAFVSPRLNVVLHTVHQSLRSVVETLDASAVAETLIFSANCFVQLTGKPNLRVALCALNPHAGEQGAFGNEELLLDEAILQAEASFMDVQASPAETSPTAIFPFDAGPPADEWQTAGAPSQRHTWSTGQRGLEVLPGRLAGQARRLGPKFFGPLPSDSVFHRAAQGEFDLVVALYHDQGLIPVKLLEPTKAVNLTLGLPFIRTSPDHGTAFDIAGQWIADSRNFLEATALAIRLAGRVPQPR